MVCEVDPPPGYVPPRRRSVLDWPVEELLVGIVVTVLAIVWIVYN